MSGLDHLVGQEVDQVWIWWSLRLVFDLGDSPESSMYVDVTNFRFVDPRGQVHEVRVEEDAERAGVVLSVLHHRVTAASAPDWRLELSFDNGATLICPPDPRYEAWAATPGWFCPPGGGDGAPG